MGRTSSGRWHGIWRTNGSLAALIAAAAVALCMVSGATEWLENRVYDAATTITPALPLAEIAIVGIDDASLRELGSWPWPRDLHAKLIDQLIAAGAKTIALTPSFVGPESDRGLVHIRKMREAVGRVEEATPSTLELAGLAAEAENALDTDARLAASIRRAGNVFLASRHPPVGAPTQLPPYAHRSALDNPGAMALGTVNAGQYPLDALGSVAAGVGHLAAQADRDGAVRQIPLLVRHDNTTLPSLALLAARHSLHLGPGELRTQDSPPGLRLGGLHIATDASAVLRPRFHASEQGPPFPVTSFARVIQGKAPPHSFKDKIVLVGEMSDALVPPLARPGRQQMYPVELLAHTVSAIRQGQSVLRPAWAGALSSGAVVAALLWLVLALPRLTRSAGWVASAALVIGLTGLEWALLRHAGLWVPLAPGVVALLAGTVAFTALRTRGGTDPAQVAAAAEADRMMGLALHGQGELDMAFERLRKLPPSDALMGNLYHLGQDFERQRRFEQAKGVYKHILLHQRDFKDVRARYKRVRALALAANGSPVTPSSALQPAQRLPGNASAAIPMLGRYQIDKELGKGAMGVVYLGRDPKIGRVVAIKTLALSEEFEGEALVDARTRFFREAETAGRLQHPCIVTIFDAGEDHDLAYIAMEFLKGADLTQACSPGQLLPVATALSIAARVADALDYAHTHNVVHRDIKPANIMFDSATDAVKVTDFGIARITDSSKTRTGMVLGTPSFMSPEQLAGKRVDGRSDLYSLGVMLFQLLTGSLPLRGESMTELMHKIANVDAPDVRQLRPELSPAVARVLATALQKRLETRYQTGRQLASDLRQAVAEHGQTGAPEPAAVVYDALRDTTGYEMVDFRTTVMEPSAGRVASFSPDSGAR